jgi:hypothetical protein
MLSSSQNGRTIGVLRSRKSMLETLLRRLDMVRLTVVAAALVMMTACSGLIDDGGNGGLTPAQAKARKLFLTKALPVLSANCNTCHDGSRANLGFMAGDTDIAKHDALLAYQPAVVNLDAPGSSRVLTKGQHEGPPLDGQQTSDILEWLQAEKEAAGDSGGGPDPKLQTTPIAISPCTSGLPDNPPSAPNPNCPVNSIPLDMVGDGIAGANIKFVVQVLGSGLYFNEFKVVPGTAGVYIEHPLIVAYGTRDASAVTDNCELVDAASNTYACADTIDRYNAVKMDLDMTATPDQQLIAGGAGAFVGFLPSDQIGIHFKAASVFVPDSGGTGGTTGCKDLATFKTIRAAFNAPVGGGQACTNCHAGSNQSATTTMNLSKINDADDANVLLACNEVRSRLDFSNFLNSSIVLAPAPGNGNHPFNFVAADHTTFENLINNPDPTQSWYVKERDLP